MADSAVTISGPLPGKGPRKAIRKDGYNAYEVTVNATATDGIRGVLYVHKDHADQAVGDTITCTIAAAQADKNVLPADPIS